nr:hypothetical protein [Escherichia coli]
MKPSYEELEEQLNRSRRLCDAALANERAWETAMMQACGEDGPKSVADKFAELEARCATLAAENIALKSAHPQQFGQKMMDALVAYEECQDDVPERGMLNAFFILRDSVCIDTPATDAFLAEVRAQGVDAAIEAAKNLVAQEYEYKDFKAAQSDCCMHPGSDLVGKVEMTEWLVDFAAQLRKGGNQ